MVVRLNGPQNPVAQPRTQENDSRGSASPSSAAATTRPASEASSFRRETPPAEGARRLGSSDVSSGQYVALGSIRPGELAAEPRTVTASTSPNTAIQDNSKVESTLRLEDDLDIQKLAVKLDVGHSYRGDLMVSLTSPSGKSAVISNRAGGSADDLKGSFDLSAFAGESSKGDWKLTVEDKARGDVGTLRTWGLEVTGTPKEPPPPPPQEGVITKSATPNAPIPDNQTVTSTIDVAEGATVDKLQLDLDIAHTYRGDLVVSLTSPSGKSAVISNKAGGSADDLKGSFDLSAFAGEKATGQWKLTVQDTASQDTGTLKSWGLKITPKDAPPPPPPPPVNDDSDPMKHIKYLASDEMKGRDSPSAELAAAAAYIESYAKKYGLTGPNTNNPGNPYQQAFDLYSFGGPEQHALPTDGTGIRDPSKWGSKPFEEAFYLDDKMSPESLKLVNQRYEETMKELGRAPAPSLSGGMRSVEELRQLAQPGDKVQNVMGMLKGTGPHKDEVIVVMAHLDHVGVGSKGVFNGADDNASGSAVLMASIPELVEAQKRGELDRSVLFLWTGAEEKGLVGSQYFVDHPIPGVGLKEISGVVNMDMIGRWDDQRISLIDSNSNGRANYFKEITEQANQQMADPFDRMNHDINAYRDRQDGAAFTRKGEDVLFVFEGLSNPNGGGQLNPDYHGTGDDVDKIIQDNGGNKPRRVKDFMVNVLKLASNRVAQPAVDWR